MSRVTGSLIHEKLRELIPSLSSSITPQVLDKLCEKDSLQAFLKWFHVNINRDNLISEGCIKLREHVEKNYTWFQGTELDLALAEVTQACPELLKLMKSDYWNTNQSRADLDSEKDLFNQDLEHLRSIENSIQELKVLEEVLDKELEAQADTVKREEIKVQLIHNDCMSTLEVFDSCHRQFYTAVELLANTYLEAVEKKGEPCMWTQMPMELCIKQLDIYNTYLNTYATRQFSMSSRLNDMLPTDHSSLLNETCENEKLSELVNCQKSLFMSKIHEIMAKVEEDASRCLVNYVKEIYNDGNLKVPSTPILARAEIAELTEHRDFLEEGINLLQEQQMVELVQHLSKAKVIKVMENEAQVRLERRRNKLSRLETLCALAKENGHAFSTLLCMLFELQVHQINEIIQFVLDARHYLSMEYSLSSTRSDILQKLQREYDALPSSAKDHNSFERFLIESTALEDSRCDLQASAQYYEELKKDNAKKIQILLREKMEEMIEGLRITETRVMDQYNQEILHNPTLGFTAVPWHIQNELDKTLKRLEKLESLVDSVKNKFKTMMKETSTPNFERDKSLIWQRFLADPQSMKIKCEELEQLRDNAVF